MRNDEGKQIKILDNILPRFTGKDYAWMIMLLAVLGVAFGISWVFGCELYRTWTAIMLAIILYRIMGTEVVHD